MPDDQSALSHVSLRVPSDLIDAFDRLAGALDRSRSWVMLRALRQYLEEGEGAEVVEDTESIAELDRGEIEPFEKSLRRVMEIVAKAEAASADKK